MEQDGPMHVLIAADAFGATLGPRTTGDALAAGWARGAPHDTVEVRPLSDGGHGFVALVGDALGVRPEPDGVLVVPGTHGTSTVYIDGHGCIDAGRSSAWLAEQIEHALSLGATRIVVGLPGPHETVRGPDAGAALLGALGALAPERHGRWTGRLGAVTASDLGGLAAVRERLRGVDLVGATASDVPLLGLHGASASAAAAGVLGAQEAHDLEREIGHFAHVVRGILAPLADLRRPLPLAGSTRGDGARADVARALTTGAGTGAAGGLGFALCALGGRLVPGADVFGDTARVSERAERADLVLTARGELDGSSFQGRPSPWPCVRQRSGVCRASLSRGRAS